MSQTNVQEDIAKAENPPESMHSPISFAPYTAWDGHLKKSGNFFCIFLKSSVRSNHIMMQLLRVIIGTFLSTYTASKRKSRLRFRVGEKMIEKSDFV